MTTGQIIIAAVAAAVTLCALLAWFWIVRPYRRARASRMRDPVRGTMLVTQMSPASEDDSVWQGGMIAGIVTIPGEGQFVHRRQAMILTDKFPRSGDTLPIIIDRADRRRLAIQWDEFGVN
jgi:hypothetical protein